MFNFVFITLKPLLLKRFWLQRDIKHRKRLTHEEPGLFICAFSVTQAKLKYKKAPK
jgi:hypothetical protein